MYLFKKALVIRDSVLQQLKPVRSTLRLSNMTVLLASTDVHEFGVFVLYSVLREMEANVVYAGLGVDPEDLVEQAAQCKAKALLLSTHNGMALSYGRTLRQALDQKGIKAPVFMGGRLNQDMPRIDHPVDVTGALKKLQIHPTQNVEKILRQLKQIYRS